MHYRHKPNVLKKIVIENKLLSFAFTNCGVRQCAWFSCFLNVVMLIMFKISYAILNRLPTFGNGVDSYETQEACKTFPFNHSTVYVSQFIKSSDGMPLVLKYTLSKPK